MSWQDAIDEWRDIVGVKHVETDAEALEAASRATFPTSQTIPAIVSPADTAEVQACVAIAQRHGCPLYPISRGKNWGLGSRVPAADGCAILSLHRLDRIVEIHEKLGYMVVEPGVTFRQAQAALEAQGSQMMLSVIGGSPDASIIGNIVERGDGIGPNGVRLHHACAMEVVLPDGQLLHTSMGRYPGAHAAPISQWGVGPALDGLFTQSNLGIVTRLTVWLHPRPAWFQLFVAEIEDRQGLAGLIDVLQPLAMQGIVQPGALHFWNGYKLIARRSQYPWAQQGESTPLTPEQRPALGRWVACGAQYCASEAHGAADRRAVELALTPYVDRLIFNDQRSHPEILKANPMLGVPYDDNVFSTYWRKRQPPPEPMDPDRDGCGVHWLCLEFPFDGMLIDDAIAGVEATILTHGFEPNLGVSCVSGRAVRMFVAVVYDRDRAGQDQRATECHDALLALLLGKGHVPCRLGIQTMPQMPPGDGAYAAVVQQLKDILDPGQILAPGRYQWEPICSKK